MYLKVYFPMTWKPENMHTVRHMQPWRPRLTRRDCFSSAMTHEATHERTCLPRCWREYNRLYVHPTCHLQRLQILVQTFCSISFAICGESVCVWPVRGNAESVAQFKVFVKSVGQLNCQLTSEKSLSTFLSLETNIVYSCFEPAQDKTAKNNSLEIRARAKIWRRPCM